jgi:hypothetical protein
VFEETPELIGFFGHFAKVAVCGAVFCKVAKLVGVGWTESTELRYDSAYYGGIRRKFPVTDASPSAVAKHLLLP